MLARVLTMATVMCGLAGCAAAPSGRGVDAASAVARVRAFDGAASRGDRASVPECIDALTADDPVVRRASIDALRRLTGETFGYDPDAPASARSTAIEAWVSWYDAESRSGGMEADGHDV